jgi:enoyl-CoA hydratase/carnithine racemase
MEIRRDGYVTVITGAADAPFAEVIEAIERAAESGCRCAVFHLRGPGAAPGDDVDARWMERCGLPLVAALDGEVTGAAAAIALSADIRVASPSAMVGGGAIGSRRSLMLLGQAGSVRVLESGGKVDSGTALQIGLVSAVAGDALAEAMRLAGIIASRGPIAVRFAKEAIWRGAEQPLEQALRFETDLTILLQSTKDRAEGVAAFLEKRPAAFTGD